MTLTPDDLERHKRHILLREIGGPGVQKLRAARVSIVGAGALGGPCAMYLAAAGCGLIELVDDDHVELSNLQRQIQFCENDTGALKVEALARRLSGMHVGTQVIARPERFGAASELAGDILIDASDNFETRFALNQLAHDSGRLLVSGAATGWSGQVGVFASGVDPGAPCYRCLVPQLPQQAADCSTQGVVGPVTGLVAARMALETLKLVTGAGEALIGRIWIVDALSGAGRVVRLHPDTDCPVCAG